MYAGRTKPLARESLGPLSCAPDGATRMRAPFSYDVTDGCGVEA